MYLSDAQNANVGARRGGSISSTKYSIQNTGKTLNENPSVIHERENIKKQIKTFNHQDSWSDYMLCVCPKELIHRTF